MHHHSFMGWKCVAHKLRTIQYDSTEPLNEGQRASLNALAERLPNNGVIIADEVGMGKTRIAAMAARAVTEAGGRVAILVPPGLGYQWGSELQTVGLQDTPPLLRSLWQYLKVWDPDDRGTDWFKHPVVLISHAFTNWQLRAKAAPWRWALLPELYAHWHKLTADSLRFPRHYHNNEKLEDPWTKQAAASITEAIKRCPKKHPARAQIEQLLKETPWPGALEASEYQRDAQLRPWLERAVGLGLGVFDLVIIDEAHKSRGQESGLQRLLDQVIQPSSATRRLAMTATPVELDAQQWSQMLDRIQLNTAGKTAVTQAINDYIRCVEHVRNCLSNPQVREAYKAAARAFERALGPYLLRRDKREDKDVQLFQEKTQESYHAYRQEKEIRVSTERLPSQWAQAICAAEALSFATRQTQSLQSDKRMRLTLGNGHGIATLIDQSCQDAREDAAQIKEDEKASKDAATPAPQVIDDKRAQRIAWWKQQVKRPLDSNPHGLFNHPALLTAVEAIETVCNQDNEKVLVFGRFTHPMRALVQLLNARALLRCLDANKPWPQSKVPEQEWPALEAAHIQLKRTGNLDQEALEQQLDKQYQQLEQQRQHDRDQLIPQLKAAFADRKEHPAYPLFQAFQRDVQNASQTNDKHLLALVARALHELTDHTNTDYAQAFIELMDATGDLDVQEESEASDEDENISERWKHIKVRLYEEYSSPQGGFARLMNGETHPSTRRLLQLAFNRPQAHPKVLVAQSVVGREGLNLHQACRTVVLLHPEWNPGVVEQQIGRVDRIGSLWARQLREFKEEALGRGGEWPRIRVLSVVFEGTYDEHNWRVLHERWDDLRAQLHGIVISPRIAKHYENNPEFVSEINDAAPRFSPPAPPSSHSSGPDCQRPGQP